jgi:hypothetical protein
MDWKSLAAATWVEVKDGLGSAYDKLTDEEKQQAKDTVEELAIASGLHLIAPSDSTADRVSRAKTGLSALAFGGALIARGVLAEKALSAVTRVAGMLLSLALSKL